MKVLGFGASSVEGVGDDEAGGFLRRLEQKLRAAGRPAKVVNLGVGGHTTVDMLARVNEARRHLPSAVVVLLGCNDLPRVPDQNPERRTDLPTYRANLRRILAALHGPESLFISSFAVSQEKTGVRAEVLAAYMEAAVMMARELGYQVWDLQTESRAWGGRYLAADGVHFGPAGHELLATGVMERLVGNRQAASRARK